MQATPEADLVVESARFQERECANQVVVQRPIVVAECRRAVLPQKETELLEVLAPPFPHLENQRLAKRYAFSRDAPAGVQQTGREDDRAVSPRHV